MIFRCILLTAVLSFFACIIQAQEKDVRGTIHALDVQVGTITLRTGKDFKPQTFSLSKLDLPVNNYAGQALKVTDLGKDQQVLLKFAGEDVSANRLDSPCMRGYLSGFDAAARTVTLKDDIRQKSFTLPRDLKFYHNGKPASWEQLKNGDPAHVFFGLDGKTPLLFEAGKGVMAQNYYRTVIPAHGILMEIDVARNKLKYLAQKDIWAIKEVDFDPQAEVRLFDDLRFKPIFSSRMSDLQPYGRIAFKMESDVNRIVQMDVEMQWLNRYQVAGIDAAKREVTLVKKDERRVFSIHKDAKIYTLLGEEPLTKLKQGDLVLCWLNPQRDKVMVLRVVDR